MRRLLCPETDRGGTGASFLPSFHLCAKGRMRRCIPKRQDQGRKLAATVCPTRRSHSTRCSGLLARGSGERMLVPLILSLHAKRHSFSLRQAENWRWEVFASLASSKVRQPLASKSILARPICLVQFEQRSGDNFAVRFSLAGGQRFLALAYCPYCPLTPEFGYIWWKIWKWAKEWTVRRDSKICDLR
jgi:hypothetical protein